MSELPPLSLLPLSSPSLPIHMPSAWSCDGEGVIGMVAALMHAMHTM